MCFENFAHAARLMAGQLASYRGSDPLILAIPRSGVALGRIVACKLDGELDVALVQHLRAPDGQALAIGSLGETGTVRIGTYARLIGIPEAYLEQEVVEQRSLLARRRASYSPGEGPADPRGRVVILTAATVRTGFTLSAALEAVREGAPARLIVAAAVARIGLARRFCDFADDVICLEETAEPPIVADHFQRARPVTDDDVRRMILDGRALRKNRAAFWAA